MSKTTTFVTVLLASLAASAVAIAVPGVWAGAVLAGAGAIGLGCAAAWLTPRESHLSSADGTDGTLLFSHVVGSWSVSGYSSRDDGACGVVVAIAEMIDLENGTAAA